MHDISTHAMYMGDNANNFCDCNEVLYSFYKA
jgi:hypothetical protein